MENEIRAAVKRPCPLDGQLTGVAEPIAPSQLLPPTVKFYCEAFYRRQCTKERWKDGNAAVKRPCPNPSLPTNFCLQESNFIAEAFYRRQRTKERWKDGNAAVKLPCPGDGQLAGVAELIAPSQLLPPEVNFYC
jgi:hypothetical protein